MEIEITSKRNNPLCERTEVYFTIHHEGEGTPNRDLVRNELAEKLNVKKEHVAINYIQTNFGVQKSTGYTTVYSSLDKAKNWERDYILKRNKIIEEKEEKKPEEEKPPAKQTPEPEVKTEEKPGEKPSEEPEEKTESKEEKKQEEKKEGA
jgi:ribosomal protein S24E